MADAFLYNSQKRTKSASLTDLRKTTLGVASKAIAKGLNACVSFFTSILVVRAVSMQDYAAYKQLGGVIFFVAIFSSFSLEQIVNRYVSEFIAQRRWSAVLHVLLGTLLFRILVLGFILFTLGSFLKPWLFTFLNLSPLLWDWWFIISLMMAMALTYNLVGRGFLTTFLEQHIVGMLDLVEGVLVLLCVVMTLVFGQITFSALMFAVLITKSLLFTLYSVLLWRRIVDVYKRTSEQAGLAISRLDLRRILKFGSVRTLSLQISSLKNINVDILAISHYLSLASVSLYGFAQVIASAFVRFSPANLMNPVVQPLIVRRHSNGNGDEVLQFSYSFLQKINLFFLVPMLAVILVFIDKITLFVFNPKYLLALPTIYVLSSFYFIRSVVYPFDVYIRVLEKNRIQLLSASLTFYNLLMYIILIPRFGAIGAAFATGSTGMLELFVIWGTLRYLEAVRPVFPWLALIRVGVNTCLMTLVLLLTRIWVNSIYGVLCALSSAGIVYLYASYKNRIFSERDRRMLNSAIGKNVWVF